jgi:hypothetical protein
MDASRHVAVHHGSAHRPTLSQPIAMADRREPHPYDTDWLIGTSERFAYVRTLMPDRICESLAQEGG